MLGHPDTQFLIAGIDSNEGGSISEKIREIGEDLSINSNVTILNNKFEASIALQAMDISVLTSESEGLSNTLLESMVLGKPVIATSTGGNREVVIHESTGFLVPVGNVTKISEAIIKLIANPHLREKMGTEGKKCSPKFIP